MSRRNTKRLRLQLPISPIATTPGNASGSVRSSSPCPENQVTSSGRSFKICSTSGANLNLEETLSRRSHQHQNRIKNVGTQISIKLIYKYHARSLSELYDKCSAEEWASLVYTNCDYHRCINNALELYIKDSLQLQRKNRWEYLLSHSKYNEKEEKEILRLFKVQGVDPVYFTECLYNVLNCQQNKINAIKICGVPNSGKTLLAQLIASVFISCYANNHGSESEFFLSNFLNKSLIVCEELYITRATCEDFKSILGGAAIDIAKKFQEKQILARTPMIITSNYDTYGRGHLPPVDEMALRKRSFSFYFGSEFVPACQITAPSLFHFFFLALNQDML